MRQAIENRNKLITMRATSDEIQEMNFVVTRAGFSNRSDYIRSCFQQDYDYFTRTKPTNGN